MPLEGSAEGGQVQVPVDPAELLAGFEHAGGTPTQRHLPVPPPFDVLRVLAADGDHRLDRVRRSQGAGQGGRHAVAEHGQRLVQALAQAGRRTRVGLAQLGGQRLQPGLGIQRGRCVVGRPHPPFDRAA